MLANAHHDVKTSSFYTGQALTAYVFATI